jgi:hypothetical protein
MDIKHIGTDGARGPDRSQRTVAPLGAARPVAPAGAVRRDEDRIEISAEARALAEASADAPLSPEQLAELRQWIADGGYDAPEVLDVIARRLLQSGEV